MKKILITIAAICFAFLKVASWVILLVILWTGATTIEVHDLAYYGNWNQETIKMLQDYDFLDGGLPTKAEVQEYGGDFRYYYKENRDYQFSISVVLYITDEDVLEEKLNEIEEREYDSIITTEENITYFLRYSESWIEEYFDDRIFDGMCFRVEITEVDRREEQIRYLAAVVVEGDPDKAVDEYLKKVYSYIQ